MTDKDKILAEIQKRIEFQKTCIKNDYRLTGRAEEEIILEYQKLINIINTFPKEPVSEDLEEAVNAYIGYAPEVDESSSTYGKRQAFKAGAKWQKYQLMEKAVNGFVIEDIEEGNGDFLLSADYLSKDIGLKDRQKVKVIVIKETEL